MPQIDFDGANSRLSADNIRGQSGSTITIVSGHNLVGSGSGLTALNATNLASGTVPTARLGSGTANNGVFLRGDGTWAAAGGGVDGIVSSADATAITIDANEKVGIVTTTPNSYEAEASQLVVGTTSGNNGITIASGTSNVGSIYFADGTVGSGKYVGYITYTHSTNRFSFGANAATKLAIDSDGVKFGTDTAAANALNDYEEGTFTIGQTFSSGSATIATQHARYTKIGQLVAIQANFSVGTPSSPSGTWTVTGLPFTILSGQTAYFYVTLWNTLPSATQSSFFAQYSGGTSFPFWEATNSTIRGGASGGYANHGVNGLSLIHI